MGMPLIYRWVDKQERNKWESTLLVGMFTLRVTKLGSYPAHCTLSHLDALHSVRTHDRDIAKERALEWLRDQLHDALDVTGKLLEPIAEARRDKLYQMQCEGCGLETRPAKSQVAGELAAVRAGWKVAERTLCNECRRQ